MNLVAEANRTIRKAPVKLTWQKKNWSTNDIIKMLQEVDKKDAIDLELFAQSFKTNSIKKTSRKIWQFIRQNIRYENDGYNFQHIKTPAALWKTKIGDCKSFSVFAGAILQNLRIPYKYRFVSYSDDSQPTHVFVVVPNGNKEIILDAVWPVFNTTKQYTFKMDKKGVLARIEGPQVSGILQEVGDFFNVFNDGALGNWKKAFNTQFDLIQSKEGSTQRLNDLLIYQRNLLNQAQQSGQLDYKKFIKLESWSDRLVLRSYKPAKFGQQILKWVFFPIPSIFSTSKKQSLIVFLREGAEFFAYLHLPLEVVNNPNASKILKKVAFQQEQAEIIMDGLGLSQAAFDQIIDSEIRERHGISAKQFVVQNLEDDFKTQQSSGTRPLVGEPVSATVVAAISAAVVAIVGLISTLLIIKDRRRRAGQDFINATMAQGDFGPWACQYLATLDAPRKMIKNCEELAEQNPDGIPSVLIQTNNSSNNGNGGGNDLQTTQKAGFKFLGIDWKGWAAGTLILVGLTWEDEKPKRKKKKTKKKTKKKK